MSAYTGLETVSVAGTLSIFTMIFFVISIPNFCGFRHVVPACNELRQSGAMMNHNLRVISHLMLRKNHLQALPRGQGLLARNALMF